MDGVEAAAVTLTPAERKRMALEAARMKARGEMAPGEVTTTATATATTTATGESLVDIARRMRKQDEADPEAAARRKREMEEQRVLESAKLASAQALVSAQETAHDAKRERVQRAWLLPRSFDPAQREGEAETPAAMRKRLGILVDGRNVPDPISSFRELGIPLPLLRRLEDKGITSPSPIQMQGLPVVLAGRDMIGVASTGSGKTLTFILPALLFSLDVTSSRNNSIGPGEGPLALILGPSRELQRQTFQILVDLAEDFPHVSISLAIGGESKPDQLRPHRHHGTHVLVGTPGRVKDFVSSHAYSMSRCDLVVLDEGDRMLDTGFDEEVRTIMSRAPLKRQTVMISATMPRKIAEFAREALLDPVVVNVGRTGAASTNITQQVQYVKEDQRFVALLDALAKTGPPVLVFASRASDVDDVEEYLLLKGVRAVGIHGGRVQEDRNAAVDAFKRREMDVLVASDVAAKGLDFPAIAHVINFDMPSEIETYVHRVGRTGRGGAKGFASTFVDKDTSETVLVDLAALLREAKQTVPRFLEALAPAPPPPPPPSMSMVSASASASASRLAGEDPGEEAAASFADTDACAFCGGFGHRITSCPRVAAEAKKNFNKTRDLLKGGRD